MSQAKELQTLCDNKQYVELLKKCTTNGKIESVLLARSLHVHQLLALFEWLSLTDNTANQGFDRIDLINAMIVTDKWMALDVLIENGFVFDEKTRMFLPVLVTECYDKIKRNNGDMSIVRRCSKWLKSRGLVETQYLPEEFR